MLEDEKSWSEQVQEFEDEENAFQPSRDMSRTPPPKRNAALSNPFAPTSKKSTDMLARLEPRPDASKLEQSGISATMAHEEPNGIIAALKAIRDKLAKQNTRGEPLNVKIAVLADIDNLIADVANKDSTFPAPAPDTCSTNTSQDQALRFSKLENDITEIKQALCESLKVSKTWAQVARNSTSNPEPQSSPRFNPHTPKKLQVQAEIRQERAQHQITLTAVSAPAETKTLLAAATHTEITERCQRAIRSSIGESLPPLRGIQRLKSNDIRIICESSDEIAKLRQVNWNNAYEGLVLHQPKFGVVIHDVPLHVIPQETLNASNASNATKPIIKQIEEQNSNLNIAQMRPLRRNFKPSESTKSSSIVIFTHSVEAADQIIRRGIYISHRLYPAEKYTPQLRVTQCYNCRGFGHHAAQCRNKGVCGRCSGDHPTTSCSETIAKCSGCGGNHEAWHPECPRWQQESKRLKELSQNTPSLFQ
jgi:hypothetical protein